jgi:hypothetical protein
MDHRLAAVHPEARGQGPDRVVRHRQHDELDLVEEGVGLGKGAGTVDEAAEPIAPLRVAAGDRGDGPAGPPERDSEGRPDGPSPDDPDDRRLARLAPDVGMGVVVVVDELAVTVPPGRRRVEVDAGLADRGFGLVPADRFPG